MKKIILILALMMFLTIPIASASIGEDIFDIVESVVGFLFIDEAVQGLGGSGLFYFKVLFWLLTFSIFYAAFIMIPFFKNAGPRITATVAIVLALISVIFLPQSVIESLSRSFGMFVAFFLVIGALSGTLFVMKFFPYEQFGKGSYAAKAALLYLCGIILYQIRYYEEQFNLNVPLINLKGLVDFATGIIFLAVIWYIFMAMFGKGIGKGPAASSSGDGSGLSGILDLFKGDPSSASSEKKSQSATEPYPKYLKTVYNARFKVIGDELKRRGKDMYSWGRRHIAARESNPWNVPNGLPQPPENIAKDYTQPRNYILKELMPAWVKTLEDLAKDRNFHRYGYMDSINFYNIGHRYIEEVRKFISEYQSIEGELDYSHMGATSERVATTIKKHLEACYKLYVQLTNEAKKRTPLNNHFIVKAYNLAQEIDVAHRELAYTVASVHKKRTAKKKVVDQAKKKVGVS